LDLDGKVAIVTGGGRGIGRATALALAAEGAKVAVAARSGHEIQNVSSEIRSKGGDSLAIECDVASEDDVDAMIQKIVDAFGRVDILVCNAAIIHDVIDVVDMSLEQWRAVIDINLTGVFLCCKAVISEMMKQRSGKIVIVGAMGAKRGKKGRSAYRASKAALVNLTETLDLEASEHGINVNCVSPGPVVTKMLLDTYPNIDVGPFAQPEDVANVILFLVSEKSRAMHGAVVDVAGVGDYEDRLKPMKQRN